MPPRAVDNVLLVDPKQKGISLQTLGNVAGPKLPPQQNFSPPIKHPVSPPVEQKVAPPEPKQVIDPLPAAPAAADIVPVVAKEEPKAAPQPQMEAPAPKPVNNSHPKSIQQGRVEKIED